MCFWLEVNVVNEGGKEHEHPRAISKEENKKENVKNEDCVQEIDLASERKIVGEDPEEEYQRASIASTKKECSIA